MRKRKKTPNATLTAKETHWTVQFPPNHALNIQVKAAAKRFTHQLNNFAPQPHQTFK